MKEFLAILFVTVLILALTVLISAESFAESKSECVIKFEEVEKKLNLKYGEQKVFIGVSSSGTELLYLFLNKETGSWTFILRNRDGCAKSPGAGDGGILLDEIIGEEA